jgi:hypothetical protein
MPLCWKGHKHHDVDHYHFTNHRHRTHTTPLQRRERSSRRTGHRSIMLGWQVAVGAAAASSRFIFRRVVLLSNGSQKQRGQSQKDTSNDKVKGEKMLLGLLPCQTGGSAHCVTWRGDTLYAGDVFVGEMTMLLMILHGAQCSANSGGFAIDGSVSVLMTMMNIHTSFLNFHLPIQAATTAAYSLGRAYALADHRKPHAVACSRLSFTPLHSCAVPK